MSKTELCGKLLNTEINLTTQIQAIKMKVNQTKLCSFKKFTVSVREKMNFRWKLLDTEINFFTELKTIKMKIT